MLPRAMPRIALDILTRALEAAYRGDDWHSLRSNLRAVRPEHWHVKPAHPAVEVFGSADEADLSIADRGAHVGWAKFMYGSHAFRGGTLDLASVAPSSREMAPMLAWLDEAHRYFQDAVATIEDDAELTVARPTPWVGPLPTERIISIVINYDLYHSCQINQQRSLIQGADGWAPGTKE